MSTEILGAPFDIHGGGLDLKFPHHENELAQSCCYSGNLDNKNSYAKYWMHNGFVTIEAEKMSKSLGNIKLVKDYLKLYDGEVIRLALLSAHYRSPLNWNEKLLIQSKNIISKYNKILENLADLKISSNSKNNHLINDIKGALLDDLNISKALSVLDLNVKEINKKDKAEKIVVKEAIEYLGNIVGLFVKTEGAKPKKSINNDEINLLIKRRNEARKNKDYEIADNLRKKLEDMGVEINDQANGSVWKKV